MLPSPRPAREGVPPVTVGESAEPVKARVRRLLGHSRQRALSPVTAGLDRLERELTARLEDLTRRVTEIEVLIQTLDGRAASGAERTVSVEESQARIARRLEAIEQLLAGDEPG